ncbi:MAG: arginase family protein [Neisseria sp.]|uniref:arginase family protein n=1 Tax=Neisseria sp. TaxID=192066 RepID=UPI0026DD7C06|nr:arginase family protein [Neisseria sp.]MDO4640309.1 arginase family protein [Neisseria sp.]
MHSTLRLIFPQWQGGQADNIADYVSELDKQDAYQGYYLGSQLLAWLAPKTEQTVATVPVSLADQPADLAEKNGIFAYNIIKKQLAAALSILDVYQPDRIVTLGGECSVSVPPFSYLAQKYEDNVAVVWLDAHRDLTIPHTDYSGYHAMSLAKLLGQGDSDIINMLPATLKPENALIVGLRTTDGAVERQKTLGVKSLSPEQVNDTSQAILEWLKQTGKEKVMIHLDLDVLEPTDLKIAVAYDPDGINIENTIRIICDIAEQSDLIGLTIAEPMPREVIKLKKLLNSLPLLK